MCLFLTKFYLKLLSDKIISINEIKYIKIIFQDLALLAWRALLRTVTKLRVP
jgi:hypothetical protein